MVRVPVPPSAAGDRGGSDRQRRGQCGVADRRFRQRQRCRLGDDRARPFTRPGTASTEPAPGHAFVRRARRTDRERRARGRPRPTATLGDYRRILIREVRRAGTCPSSQPRHGDVFSDGQRENLPLIGRPERPDLWSSGPGPPPAPAWAPGASPAQQRRRPAPQPNSAHGLCTRMRMDPTTRASIE